MDIIDAIVPSHDVHLDVFLTEHVRVQPDLANAIAVNRVILGVRNGLVRRVFVHGFAYRNDGSVGQQPRSGAVRIHALPHDLHVELARAYEREARRIPMHLTVNAEGQVQDA